MFELILQSSMANLLTFADMKILMVCLGNICRSPMAEGILRKKAESRELNLIVDSAGTGGWHVGQHPDKRAIQTAKEFGVDISRLTGRQFSEKDFDLFDRIYVMDASNYADVLAMTRNEQDRLKVDYLLNASSPGSSKDIPDPYYGGEDGFVKVFRMMDKACDGIIKELEQKLKIAG